VLRPVVVSWGMSVPQSMLLTRLAAARQTAAEQVASAQRPADRSRWQSAADILAELQARLTPADHLTGGTVATVATPLAPEPPTTGPRKGRLAGLIRGRS
jgi:hypothetical protein